MIDVPQTKTAPLRVLTALQEALAELEVWRQNARVPEEFSALRRMATSLADAKHEVEEMLHGVPVLDDSNQRSLLPPR